MTYLDHLQGAKLLIKVWILPGMGADVCLVGEIKTAKGFRSVEWLWALRLLSVDPGERRKERGSNLTARPPFFPLPFQIQRCHISPELERSCAYTWAQEAAILLSIEHLPLIVAFGGSHQQKKSKKDARTHQNCGFSIGSRLFSHTLSHIEHHSP